MIYLASPYSHPDPTIRELRYLSAIKATAFLLRQKKWVYSPIVHNHPMALLEELPKEFGFWKDFDLHMIDCAEKLVVLRIEGWEQSVGVAAEVEYAKSINKLVEYL